VGVSVSLSSGRERKGRLFDWKEGEQQEWIPVTAARVNDKKKHCQRYAATTTSAEILLTVVNTTAMVVLGARSGR
jgi:hypothetical protein